MTRSAAFRLKTLNLFGVAHGLIGHASEQEKIFEYERGEPGPKTAIRKLTT